MANTGSQSNPSHQTRDKSREDSPATATSKALGQRKILFDQLATAGIEPYYFPQGTNTKPENEKTLPILITKLPDLNSKNHVIIIAVHEENYCGILSPELIADPKYGLEKGTILGLAKKLQNMDKNAPGLIVTNPGELRWSMEEHRGLLYAEDDRLERRADDDVDPHQDEFVFGHKDASSHLDAVIKWALESKKVADNAKFSIIVFEGPIFDVADKFKRPGRTYKSFLQRLSAVAWNGPPPDDDTKKGEPTNNDWDRTVEIIMKERTQSWITPIDPLTKESKNLEEVGKLSIKRVAAVSKEEEKSLGYDALAMRALAVEPILDWLMEMEETFTPRKI